MSERQNIEWKRSWLDDYLKWICGFANAQGGSIFIGKADDGSVVGLPNAKKLLEDIPAKAKQQLGLTLDVNLHEEGGQQFIEIHVPSSTVAISLRGRYYYHTGSTKVELTDIALNEFLLNKAGLTWDAMPEPKASIEDRYLDFTRLFRIESANTYFVIRAKSNTRFHLRESRPVDQSCGLRCDQTIRLSTYKGKRDYPKRLRRISFFDTETRKRLAFLTNDMTRF